jgi:glutathione synthase
MVRGENVLQLGIVMDPIGSIKIHKDSSFAMLLEAQRRGYRLHYLEQGDLYARDGSGFGRARTLEVSDDPNGWFRFTGERDLPLDTLDVILMRKDPPFDMEYVYTTYILERAAAAGTLVVNRPQALRDVNEKFYTAAFPACCPPTLVTRDMGRVRAFLAEQGEVVVKPLGSMGGELIFRLAASDPNLSVALETLSARGSRYFMAQRYLPAISQGDKRVLLVGGEPVPYALARLPAEGESRGNLAAGAIPKGVALSERDRWICAQVAPTLLDKGLLFVGLDVIGDYLTEINVTSPTCIRELDALYGLNIAGRLFDHIEATLAAG